MRRNNKNFMLILFMSLVINLTFGNFINAHENKDPIEYRGIQICENKDPIEYGSIQVCESIHNLNL